MGNNILEEILGSANSGTISSLASRFGIDSNQAMQAIGALAPQLSRQLRSNMGNSDGLASVLAALQNGNHSRFLNDPDTMNREDAVTEGNAILGHILGGKEGSRAVAEEAANKTGFDSGLLKQMLPLVAGMLMGGVGNQAAASGAGKSAAGDGDSSLDDVLSFLDMDGDGSAMDDVMDIAKKFF